MKQSFLFLHHRQCRNIVFVLLQQAFVTRLPLNYGFSENSDFTYLLTFSSICMVKVSAYIGLTSKRISVSLLLNIGNCLKSQSPNHLLQPAERRAVLAEKILMLILYIGKVPDRNSTSASKYKFFISYIILQLNVYPYLAKVYKYSEY